MLPWRKPLCLLFLIAAILLVPPEDTHIVHLLYVTSKHFAVLMRVYENAPEQSQAGLANALLCSTKGHAGVYRKLQERYPGGDVIQQIGQTGEGGGAIGQPDKDRQTAGGGDETVKPGGPKDEGQSDNGGGKDREKGTNGQVNAKGRN